MGVYYEPTWTCVSKSKFLQGNCKKFSKFSFALISSLDYIYWKSRSFVNFSVYRSGWWCSTCTDAYLCGHNACMTQFTNFCLGFGFFVSQSCWAMKDFSIITVDWNQTICDWFRRAAFANILFKFLLVFDLASVLWLIRFLSQSDILDFNQSWRICKYYFEYFRNA